MSFDDFTFAFVIICLVQKLLHHIILAPLRDELNLPLTKKRMIVRIILIPNVNIIIDGIFRNIRFSSFCLGKGRLSTCLGIYDAT